VSENTKRDLMELLEVNGERIRVVYEGYDRSVFSRPDDEDVDRTLAHYRITRPYVFYAGTFASHKNLGMLLDAFSEVVKAKKHALLVTAGRDDSGSFQDFRNRCSLMGLMPNVRNLGYVPRSDLPSLMYGARSFVFPSKYEGFGLAVLEAMACGAHVIAANCASLPEVIGDSGVLVDVDDTSAWTSEILKSLSMDAASMDASRSRSTERAATFSWDRTAEELAAILREAGAKGFG
jgi:glycosyltransferase involved in cell wall biosynthesis